jgi:NADPH2:quinone reductase
VVTQVGEDVDEAYVGQRVASAMAGIGGAYTSDLVVPVEALALVPDGVPSQLAAASIESYLTVLFGVTHRVTIREGEQVVVLGAGGGIGLAAVDVARSQGAEVLAVASSEEKRSLALRHGAAHAIGYDNLKDEIRAHTGGGADVVIDPVGGPAAESALRALGTSGRFCVIGFASGEIPRLPANIVLLRNRTIVGIDWGDWSREEAGLSGNARLLDELYRRIAAGELHPPEPTVAPLADAGTILTMISERRAVGKYVLVP